MLGLQVHSAMPGFLVGCWDLNRGPHTYVANTLQTESSLYAFNFCTLTDLALGMAGVWVE